jgi:O-antigen/teichoic acid export membrane protein
MAGHPIVKKILSYSSISFINGLVNFIYISFAARELTKANMGILGLFWAVSSFTTPYTSFGTANLVGINIVNYSPKAFSNFFSRLTTFVFLNTFPLILIIIGVIHYFDLPNLFGILLISISLIRCFLSFSDIMLIQEQKIKKYATEKIRTAILTLVLGGSLISFVDDVWYFYLLAIIISELISIFFRYGEKLKYYSPQIKKVDVIEYIQYGFPLVIGVIGAWVLNQSDKIIIERNFGLEVLGGYALAFQIGMLIRTFNQAIINAIVPHLYKSYKKGIYLKVQIQYFGIFLGINLLLFVGVLGFVYFIFDMIYGIKYLEFKIVVVIISGAFVFEGLYKVWDTQLTYFKKNVLKTSILFVCAIIALVCSLCFVQIFGFVGTSISVLIAYCALFIITYFASKSI